MLPSWINKKTFSWALYDFADTAFSALFITFFFPILIKVHLGGNEFQIGMAMSLSVIFAAILVPVIGAISDATGRRLPIILGAALLTAGLTILTGYSSLYLALILGFAAHITHLIAKDVYDAKMIDIVPRSLFGSLSGFGIGVGYFGTIVSLFVGYFLLSYFGWETVTGIQAMFFESGAFYVLFSLPILFFVPDTIKPHAIKLTPAIKKGFNEVLQTLHLLLRRSPESSGSSFSIFGRFLAASFFYNNGMNTVIIFLALYSREIIGIGIQEFFPVFALMALFAGIGSFLLGWLSDKFKPIPLIKWVLVLWIAVIFILIFEPSYLVFLILGALGGALLGAIWTLNRHVVAEIAPAEKIGELFGFEGLTEKFSGFLGPVIFGFLVTAYDYTTALVSVIFFFIIGLFIIRKLK